MFILFWYFVFYYKNKCSNNANWMLEGLTLKERMRSYRCSSS